MSFWNNPLAGVVVGGSISTGTQYLLLRRQDKREAHAAKAKAASEWAALQMATIAEMQENLEQGASFVSKALVEMTSRKLRGTTPIPDLLPFTRALMLCSRLEDEQLALDVRTWIRNNRELISKEDPLKEDWIAIRERRIALQDRLGHALKSYHGR